MTYTEYLEARGKAYEDRANECNTAIRRFNATIAALSPDAHSERLEALYKRRDDMTKAKRRMHERLYGIEREYERSLTAKKG